MDIIKIEKNGLFVFRIITKERTMNTEAATDLVKKHLAFVSFRDITIFSANNYTYIDLPFDAKSGTDFGKLIDAITDVERFHQDY